MIQILQCLGNTRQLVISYISVIQFGWKKIIFYSGEPATGLSLERCNRRYGSGDKRRNIVKRWQTATFCYTRQWQCQGLQVGRPKGAKTFAKGAIGIQLK